MKQPEPTSDAEIIKGLLRALIEGGGRGALTQIAGKLGINASVLRKKVYVAKRGIDETSLRAYILITESKVGPDEELQDSRLVDGLLIGRRSNGSPGWRVA